MYNSLLAHCRLTNIPSEYSICDLFTKLVAETRNEIIHKHVSKHLIINYKTQKNETIKSHFNWNTCSRHVDVL